jgi:hypothetical protein
MDKDDFKKRIARIFGIDQVTFNAPGETLEQEKVFVRINQVKSHYKDGTWISRATGDLLFYANMDKLPFGYFQRKIAEADPLDSKDFFFFDLEQSQPIFQNIGEFSLSFIYFFNGQYHPDKGIIQSIVISEGQ